ncbi:hypothetical protein BV25DRAFT_1049843 [Artomyces pyxidatus]|uniref:Uncharacterized protein n=1 Tax=Artomyces pyxidatus TaxID=48021 RepID=A0ACB8SSN4_9AGAM|nr:hypothetical protein BV25DRAFT_1049843 [Artomyces pyxidatus]
MSARKLTSLERKLHQAALLSPQKTIAQKDIDALCPDASARVGALNFLLGTGMLTLLRAPDGSTLYRADSADEVNTKANMSGDEAMVFGQIQAAGNQGIWTKHIKAKTQLHQTVVDRALKSLTQKGLVKTVPDVRYKTRKIYMLAALEPAAEMSGGPWYTDNELDTEVVRLLCRACLKLIRDKTVPKRGLDAARPLYSIECAPAYPSALHIQRALGKSKITDMELSVAQVEMLLTVLVLDGEIEKFPAFGATLWPADDSDTDDAEEQHVHEVRKRRRTSEGDGEARQRKRRRRTYGSSSDDAEDSDIGSPNRRRKHTRLPEQEGEDSESGDSSPRSTSVEEGSAYVYRAIHRERLAPGLTEAPCGQCPRFAFCREGGPVNPGECAYFGKCQFSR